MDSDRLAEIRQRASRGWSSEIRGNARQDMPDLLAEVDQLTAERDELRRRLAAFEDGQPRLDPRFVRRDGPTP